MILPDHAIKAAAQRLEDPLVVSPFWMPERLQPASLELTLDVDFIVDGERNHRNMEHLRLEEAFLAQGDFVLASTVETVHIPKDLVAQVNGKSSHARRGLVVHQTAGFIDPGFRGTITLELSNASKIPFRLTPGMPICQLVFFRMETPPERLYGSEGLNSRYQGQQGPTPARGTV